MDIEKAYGVSSPLKDWRRNPIQNNAKKAFVSMYRAGEEIPSDLAEEVLSILEKQIEDYEIKRPNGGKRPSTGVMEHYVRYLTIENILAESDNQEKVFDEMGGKNFKRNFMKWRKKYKDW